VNRRKRIDEGSEESALKGRGFVSFIGRLWRFLGSPLDSSSAPWTS